MVRHLGFFAIFLGLIFIGFASGCRDFDFEEVGVDGGGILRVDISRTQGDFGDDLLGTLCASIQHPDGTILRSWGSLDEIPESLRVTSGTYVFVAESRNRGLYPCFDRPFYRGATRFWMNAPSDTTINVAVGTGSTMAQVVFDTVSFDYSYSAYRVELRTTTAVNTDTEWLPYSTADSLRVGHFEPGTLRFRLVVTSRKDGLEYEFFPSSIRDCLAGEHRKITMKVNVTSSNNTLLVTTDSGYSHQEEMDFKLPSTTLPKPVPALRCEGFNNGDHITLHQEHYEVEGYRLYSYGFSGYSSFRLKISGAEIVEQMGGVDTFELIEMDAQTKQKLNDLGIEWDSALDTKESAAQIIGQHTSVYFDKYIRGTKIGPDDPDRSASFSLSVTDSRGLVGVIEYTDTEEIGFSTTIKKPSFGILNHGPWNYWTHHNEFRVHAKTTTDVKPVLWRLGDDQTWTEVMYFGQGQQKSSDTIYMYAQNLEPQTTNTYKLTMGEHSTDEFSGTNESIETILNGNMEEWQTSQYSAAFWKKIPYYQPYNSNQHWATNNDRTTSYRTTAFVYNYNSFSAVSHTRDAHSGSYAAELRSTSASNIDALNGLNTSQKHSQVPGMLYIGTFTYDKKTDFREDGIEYGKPYNSRPLSVSYWRTYTPYSEKEGYVAHIVVYNNDTEIGRGSFTSPAGETIENYTQNTINIEYSNRELPATSLSVIFETTNIHPAPVRKTGLQLHYNDDQGSYEPFWGAMLRIDDVVLNYGNQTQNIR